MKQAIVLAAGEGQRLRPFTVTRPKSMLAIADKPVLHFVIEALARNGIRDIIIVVGYRKEQVFDYLKSGEDLGVTIDYVTQERQLGTAHALGMAKDRADEEFLVVPGDNLIDAGTISGFIATGSPAVLVKRVEDPSRYGVVATGDGLVSGIEEKPEVAGSNLVNTGIYAFTQDVFNYTGGVLDIPDMLNKMIEDGREIRAVETTGRWLDIVYPWDIISLNNAVLLGLQGQLGGTMEKGVTVRGQVVVGDGTVIRSGTCIYGPAVIGAGCDIGPHVTIKPASTLGDNVVVSPFTHIENAVIGNDVGIGPGCIIQDSVIGKGCSIDGRFTAIGSQVKHPVSNGTIPGIPLGVIMGEDCMVENSVSVQPGAVVGNGCQVRMTRTLTGNIPDKSLVY